MQVGTVVQLKRECLENKAGALGVVFYQYDGGFQAIFENGNYDGFSYVSRFGNGETEVDFFLLKVGFCEELSTYRFKNVIQLEKDYCYGHFALVLQQRKYSIGSAL